MKHVEQIEKGEMVTVTAGPLNPVNCYWAGAGEQSVFAGQISAGESQTFGPYIQAATLALDSLEPFNVAPARNSGPVPRALTVADIGGIAPGAAVSDATDASDVVDQLNELLASLRDAGMIEPEPEVED